MSTGHRNVSYISMSVAVRRTGLSVRQVRACLERGFIVEPLSADDLRELRRIRRLRELGVNWAGIEIILNMRRRLLAAQAERTRRARIRQWPGLPDTGDLWQRRLPWEPDRE
jgi:DNA-binding transcriptional MerR regulator